MDSVLKLFCFVMKQKRAVYIVLPVSIQNKVFFNSASNCKGITKPQYLQDLDQFLMSAYLDNIMGAI